jgi:pimeloyl-ACP methyl ester carboxylesterase
LRVFATIDEAIDARVRLGHLSKEAARCIVERGVNAVDVRHESGHSDGGDTQRIGDTTAIVEAKPSLSGLSWSSDPQLTLASPTRLTEQQLAAVLPAITAPTVLVLAEPHAPYLQPAMMEARIGLVADIEVVRLSGTHHVHLEDPHAVASAMRAFLQDHPVDDAERH